MTETQNVQNGPYTHPTYASPRLERPRESAIRGVCSALARTTGTDVILWRVLFVVMVFFGGLGLVLYLAGIVLIPVVGEQRSLGERLIHGPDRRLRRGQVVLLVILGVSFGALLDNTDGVLVAAVLAVLGVLWWRGRAEGALATPAGTAAAPTTGTSGYDVAPAPAYGPHLDTELPWNPPPPRPRSPLGGLTASLALLVAGVLVLIGTTGDADIPAEVVLASALGVVGLGLMAGAWFGRSLALIALAAVLGVALAATIAARPALDAGLGERMWTPTGSASYRLGVGEATLDLREVAVREADTIGIDARVDVGHLLVIVPEGVRISLDAKAELGDIEVLGSDTNGRKASKHVDLGPEGRPQLRLDLSVRTGQVEVRRG